MSTANIQNTVTGQTGFQVPGSPIPPGWQPISQPASAPAQATPTMAPTPNPTAPSTPSSTGMNDSSFLGLMNSLNTGFQQNNALVDQKNAVLNALFGSPVDSKAMQNLPPDIQQIIQSGNKPQHQQLDRLVQELY